MGALSEKVRPLEDPNRMDTSNVKILSDGHQLRTALLFPNDKLRARCTSPGIMNGATCAVSLRFPGVYRGSYRYGRDLPLYKTDRETRDAEEGGGLYRRRGEVAKAAIISGGGSGASKSPIYTGSVMGRQLRANKDWGGYSISIGRFYAECIQRCRIAIVCPDGTAEGFPPVASAMRSIKEVIAKNVGDPDAG